MYKIGINFEWPSVGQITFFETPYETEHGARLAIEQILQKLHPSKWKRLNDRQYGAVAGMSIMGYVVPHVLPELPIDKSIKELTLKREQTLELYEDMTEKLIELKRRRDDGERIP